LDENHESTVTTPHKSATHTNTKDPDLSTSDKFTNGNVAKVDEWSDQVDDLDFLKPINDSNFTESFSDLLDESHTPLQLSPDGSNCESECLRTTLNQKGAAAAEMREVEQLLDNIFTPTPVELMKIVLYKAYTADNFGFSLSDGLYEKGVYVSGIRHGGPASSGLKEFDKILQVRHL